MIFANVRLMIIIKKLYISLFMMASVLVISRQVASAQAARSISLEDNSIQVGIASYYSNNFNGQLTSSGEIFSNKALTAASNTLPLGTFVKVTNLRNHHWVVVRINDRMNKHNKRAIDLTRFAAKKLHMVYRGIAKVKVEVIPPEFYAFYHITPDELVVSGRKVNEAESGS